MLPSLRAAPRAVLRLSRPFSSSVRSSNQGAAGAGEKFIATNDPKDRKETPNASKTTEVAVDALGAQAGTLQESASDAEKKRQMQAPNREGVWSRSQMPRGLAMSGPRFEQTIMEDQPRPFSAIELIHKQPVRWVDSSSVACDGGGGPLGHPRIFINVDKPQICWCTYCGLPYAHKHHKKFLESQPSTNYPLKPSGDPAEVQLPQTTSQHGEIEGTYPQLRAELKAESVDGQPYAQR